jgi:hypothetical protein
MRRPIVLLSLLGLVALSLSISESVFATKLKKLKADYQTAQNEFFTKYEKIKSEKEQSEFYTKENPAGKFLDRAISLAKSAGNDDSGPEAYAFAFSIAEQVPARMKESTKLAKEAIDRYPKSKGLLSLVNQLGFGYPVERADATAMLKQVLSVNPNSEVQAATTSSLARLYKGWGEPASAADEKEARKYLNDLVTKYPKTPYGERAKGDLFELDNLRVGKEFPDFEATDQDGKAWKLSDYRGKVVVIDFWGFW